MLKDKEATSLKVTWIPPEFPNGIIQKYRIIYSNNTEKNYTVDVTKGLKNASLFYILSGLNKDRSYQIYVSLPVITSVSVHVECFNLSVKSNPCFYFCFALLYYVHGCQKAPETSDIASYFPNIVLPATICRSKEKM